MCLCEHWGLHETRMNSNISRLQQFIHQLSIFSSDNVVELTFFVHQKYQNFEYMSLQLNVKLTLSIAKYKNEF